LLTSSLNDHSYTPEFAQQIGDHQRNEETYSLTNLQTKYERMQGEPKFLLFGDLVILVIIFWLKLCQKNNFLFVSSFTAAAAALPSYYQPSPSEPSTSTASTAAAALARPSSPFSATFHDYHLNYSSVTPTPVSPHVDDTLPNPHIHQMERYNYLQTTTNIYHNINNSNPLIDLQPDPAALGLLHPVVAMDTDDDDAVDVGPEEDEDQEENQAEEEEEEEETMNISDDKINNNKNDESPTDESIQIHEISSSNLNLVAAITPTANVVDDEDISTSSTAVLKSGNKENVKKHLRSSASASKKSPSHLLQQQQSLFMEKKDTRSGAFRLRNGKKLSDMVDSTKKIKRKVRSLFRETTTTTTAQSKHQKFKDINSTAGSSSKGSTTIKEKVQNFTNKTLNLVQNVMKENTLNLRSTRNQPKRQKQPSPPKTSATAKTSKKDFRKSIGDKLANLSMRSMSAMKRTTHRSTAITRIISTRKSTTKSSIPFMLSPTVLSPVVTVRRLRKNDMEFALQEFNNNGLGNRGKGRGRSTMGLTSTPAVTKKSGE
jgi:hypothetical protein